MQSIFPPSMAVAMQSIFPLPVGLKCFAFLRHSAPFRGALQGNCVLQAYSAACNKTPRNVAGRRRGFTVATGSRSTWARHAGSVTSCRIGHGRDSEKPRLWLPRERGRNMAAEEVDSKKMTLLRQHPNGRVLSMGRTSVPGHDSTLLTITWATFAVAHSRAMNRIPSFRSSGLLCSLACLALRILLTSK